MDDLLATSSDSDTTSASDTASASDFSSVSDEEETLGVNTDEEAELTDNAPRVGSPHASTSDAPGVRSPEIPEPLHVEPRIEEASHAGAQAASALIDAPSPDGSRAASPGVNELVLNVPSPVYPAERSLRMRPYYMLGNSARVLLREYREPCMRGVEIMANQRYDGDYDQALGENLPTPAEEDLSAREAARMLLEFARRPADEEEQRNAYRPGGFSFDHQLEMDRRVNEGEDIFFKISAFVFFCG